MATFEYLHTWIIAAEDVDEDDVDEGGEVPYLYAQVQGQLNSLGRQGWELVDMTPHWEWTYDTVDVTLEYDAGESTLEAPFAVPDHISGWYCTFRRLLV